MLTNPRKIIPLLLLTVLGLSFSNCEKSEKQEYYEGSVSKNEKAQTSSDTSLSQIDYGEIMNQLYDLEQQIKTNPEDLALRKSFLISAIDTVRQKIYTVGEGLPDTTITSDPIAKQSAERAALVDAQRWALYAMKWQEDVKAPAFPGEISGKVPPYRIVQKAQLLENKVYLLIEIDI